MTEPIGFYAGIGNSQNFRVKYSARSKRFCGYSKGANLKFCCRLVSANLKLTCYFSASDGDFCGMEYVCDLNKVERKHIDNFFAPSGYVSMCKNEFAVQGRNFVAFFGDDEFYDEEKKILSIGEVNENYPSFKVCSNVIVGLNGDQVRYVIIEL